jgi:hypothetical protein
MVMQDVRYLAFIHNNVYSGRECQKGMLEKQFHGETDAQGELKSRFESCRMEFLNYNTHAAFLFATGRNWPG